MGSAIRLFDTTIKPSPFSFWSSWRSAIRLFDTTIKLNYFSKRYFTGSAIRLFDTTIKRTAVATLNVSEFSYTII